jgi:virginiamycin B lyase
MPRLFTMLIAVASLLVQITMLNAPTMAAQQSGTLPAAYPMGVVAGPDGALWFTENDGIGRIALDGRISLFHVPGMVQMSAATASSVAACYCYSGIALGPDGNAYFAERHAIGRVTTSKQISTLPIKPDIGPPQSLILGPDRNLWFVVAPEDERAYGDIIVRITLSGHVTMFQPKPRMIVHGMAAGNDGNIWLTVAYPHEIARMTTNGRVISQYLIHGDASTCGANCEPYAIVAGPDGGMWFNAGLRVIGSVSSTGTIRLFALLHRTFDMLYQPDALAIGKDGRLWFSEAVSKLVGTITSSGVTREYTVPGVLADVFPSIARGGDNSMWFTEMCASNIGRVTPTGQVTNYQIPGTRRNGHSWCPPFMP